MKLGEWQWEPIETGTFKLDGGAMFGNVPKVLWEKSCPADENNRIDMALRCLLLRRNDQVILIDTGMGDKWEPKQLDMYQLDMTQHNLIKSLSSKGISPDDVTDVIYTHLHFDHAGGGTRIVDGKLIPTFANATYHVQELNLETASNPNIRERASYLKENFEPLLDAGCLKIHQKDGEIIEGIHATLSHGHTQGMQVITVYGENRSLNYLADLIPMKPHVTPTYSMGYDVNPVLVIEEKTAFLNQIEQTNGILFFEHDPNVCAAELGQDKRGRPCAGETVLACEKN